MIELEQSALIREQKRSFPPSLIKGNFKYSDFSCLVFAELSVLYSCWCYYNELTHLTFSKTHLCLGGV